MPSVVFRVDASTSLGVGHLTRCAALANELVRRGVTVSFICQQDRANNRSQLECAGFRVFELTKAPLVQSDDAGEVIDILTRLQPVDWMIVDHYELDANWESAVRPYVKNMLVIDDLANRAHNCDVLLDANYFPKASARYRNLVSQHTKLLVGPKYALLRPEFGRQRPDGVKYFERVDNIVICFGGSDPTGHTIAAIEAIRPFAKHFKKIDIVIGASCPHTTKIFEAINTLPNAYGHFAVRDIASLLRDADVSLGAGGSMNWERACLGVPSLAFGIADNQVAVLDALISDGFVLGHADMKVPDAQLMGAWLHTIICNISLLRGVAARSYSLVDGKGTKRVAGLLYPPALTFRSATLDDCDRIFAWRNELSVRSAALSEHLITYTEHKNWFVSVLEDPNRLLLLAEDGSSPVAVIRLDCEGATAEISIYRIPLAPKVHGLVREATMWVQTRCPWIKTINARVKSSNQTSLAAFLSAGYLSQLQTLSIKLQTEK
jgi:UDP-2,4-diacetamido-2,4,6-trideoxy-beta-L-altropyranose hydrolase